MYYESDNYLQHFGVKGMKWGVRHDRKALPKSSTYKKVQSAKQQYKNAKKDFNKAYNKSYSYSSRHYIGQFTNKNKKAESNRLWNDTADKSRALDKAEANYKNAKKERKTKIKSAQKKIRKSMSSSDRWSYSMAERKRAAKYVVDNNMSVSKAMEKVNNDTLKRASAMLAASGAIAIASLYKLKNM